MAYTDLRVSSVKSPTFITRRSSKMDFFLFKKSYWLKQKPIQEWQGQATLTSGRKKISTEVSQRQIHSVLSTLNSDLFCYMTAGTCHYQNEYNYKTNEKQEQSGILTSSSFAQISSEGQHYSSGRREANTILLRKTLPQLGNLFQEINFMSLEHSSVSFL